MMTIAILILLVHLAWLALVIFGALFTRRRPLWSAIHILALLWGIATEAGPWPCPLTLAEQYFENQAGWAAYQGRSFSITWTPSSIPTSPVGCSPLPGVAVCALNLGIYAWRFRAFRALRNKPR